MPENAVTLAGAPRGEFRVDDRRGRHQERAGDADLQLRSGSDTTATGSPPTRCPSSSAPGRPGRARGSHHRTGSAGRRARRAARSAWPRPARCRRRSRGRPPPRGPARRRRSPSACRRAKCGVVSRNGSTTASVRVGQLRQGTRRPPAARRR
jgi:hypothetical protein